MILVSIIIFASAFRFWDISAIGFGNDESIYSGQAAVLAGHDDYSRYFSIYRAHPLLLQFSISLLFQLFGVSDAAARAVPAIFGVLTILITYFIGKTLYNKKVGLVSALVLAFLPYHIIITRQALVDVPLSFFFILTLFFYGAIYTWKSKQSIMGLSHWTIFWSQFHIQRGGYRNTGYVNSLHDIN
jgi:predicted membrane-bound mannosyltransferase